MELTSKLYRCRVTHKREKPRRNFFSYNIYMFLIDLDEIETLTGKLKFMSYNRFNLFGFYDNDHFKTNETTSLSVKEKLQAYIKSQNIDFVPHKVKLLTNLRVLGYTFNPVSFYYLYDQNMKVKYALAEVSNTFGEMKYYLLRNFEAGYFYEIQHKYFYISPFTKPDDKLELRVGLPLEKFSITVNDIKEDVKVVGAALYGEQKPLTNTSMLTYFFRFPFVTLQIIGLIHWQALKLWMKGVKFYSKDENKSIQREIYYSK